MDRALALFQTLGREVKQNTFSLLIDDGQDAAEMRLYPKKDAGLIADFFSLSHEEASGLHVHRLGALHPRGWKSAGRVAESYMVLWYVDVVLHPYLRLCMRVASDMEWNHCHVETINGQFANYLGVYNALIAEVPQERHWELAKALTMGVKS